MAANKGPSGYDCNFINEPADALKCLICLSVAKDPRQHEECGRLFCKECIEKYGECKPCPNCKKRGGQFYVDHRSKRDISELKVKCDNVERKCEWVGTVGTLEEHVATCEFALLPCPKQCKGDSNKVKSFFRKDLDQHLEKDCHNRDYKCIYCRKKGTHAHITGEHDKTCPKKILPCPNAQEGCTDLVQRQSIDKHLATECKCTVVTCKYQSLGCTREMRRKDMAAHEEDDKLHLHMAIDMTVKLEEKNIKLQQDLDDKTSKLARDLQQDLADKTSKLERYLEQDLDDKISKLDRYLQRDLDDKTSKLEKYLGNVRLGITNSELIKFTDFKKRRKNNEQVRSPSYYITPNGYRMAIEVYANGHGDGEDTHVSVFARILKGRYDAQLKWPFIGKITFTLLNQLEDKNHYQMITDVTAADDAQVEGLGWGYQKFIRHSKLGHNWLFNTQYLKDDTLYFRISVEVTDHKPWLE